MTQSYHPTAQAKQHFQYAARGARYATKGFDSMKSVEGNSLYDLAAAVCGLAKGLQDLSDGLRATYIAIERIERELASLTRVTK